MGRGSSEGEGRPLVKYKEYRLCAAAMQPFVKLLCPLVIYETVRGQSDRHPTARLRRCYRDVSISRLLRLSSPVTRLR